MKLAAATAISEVVAGALEPEYIVPTPFDARVAPAVAAAVARQAVADGVAANFQPAAAPTGDGR
jgi:malate dehydrogenase (oxaloacetate-decarboxylating)